MGGRHSISGPHHICLNIFLECENKICHFCSWNAGEGGVFVWIKLGQIVGMWPKLKGLYLMRGAWALLCLVTPIVPSTALLNRGHITHLATTVMDCTLICSWCNCPNGQSEQMENNQDRTTTSDCFMHVWSNPFFCCQTYPKRTVVHVATLTSRIIWYAGLIILCMFDLTHSSAAKLILKGQWSMTSRMKKRYPVWYEWSEFVV